MVQSGAFEGRCHVHHHGQGDIAAVVLRHEGHVGRLEQSGAADGLTHGRVPQHIAVGNAHHGLAPSQWTVVENNRQGTLLAQQLMAFHIVGPQRVLDHPRHREPGQLPRQGEDLIHRIVEIHIVVQLESLRHDLLYGPGLVDDIVQVRGVKLEPRMAVLRRILRLLRH